MDMRVSSSSILLRSRVTVTSLKFCDPTYLNLSTTPAPRRTRSVRRTSDFVQQVTQNPCSEHFERNTIVRCIHTLMNINDIYL
jgi:hypothetical protein